MYAMTSIEFKFFTDKHKVGDKVVDNVCVSQSCLHFVVLGKRYLKNLWQNKMLAFANASHSQKACFGRRFARLPFVPLPLCVCFLLPSLISFSVCGELLFTLTPPIPLSLSCLFSCQINSCALYVCLLCLQRQCYFLLLLSFIGWSSLLCVFVCIF